MMMTMRMPFVMALTFGVSVLAACTDDSAPTAPQAGEQAQAAPDFAAAANSWTRKAPVPTPRSLMTVAAANNSLGQPVVYVMGGIDDDPMVEFLTSKVEAYNAATNTWTTKARMPVGLFQTNGSGLIGGKLYVPGGKTNAGDGTEWSPTLWAYSTSSDRWTQKADLPRVVANGITGVINGKLYVLVGECNNCTHRITPRLYRYDPATNKWDTSLPWCPQGHLQGAGGVINGKFYVAGGIGTSGALTKQVHVYDPTTNKWTAKASLRTAFSDGAGAVVSGKLYLVGGWEASRTVQAYDPATNTWTTKASMPTGRRFLGAAGYVLNGKPQVAAIGGIGSAGATVANEVYTP
jgi:N-acetylneuraminic acid mutarotase